MDMQVDLTRPLAEGETVRIVTADTDEGRYVIRHSTAHVLAQAASTCGPAPRFAIGPPIDNGFYYDLLLAEGRTLHRSRSRPLDARMREIIAAEQRFERAVVDTGTALDIFKHNKFKVEIIENAETAQGVDEGHVSLYANPPGPFVDLCRGPHVAHDEEARALQAAEGGRRVLAR